MDIQLDKHSIVIFKKYCTILKREELEDGTIVSQKGDIFTIKYLSGYTCNTMEISRDKIVGIIQDTGYFLKFNEDDKLVFIND